MRVQLASGPITVRMDSIDAPEKSQPWGLEAYAESTKRLNRRIVSLEVLTQDRSERLVAVVYLGDENVNARMVKQGNARASRRYLRNPDYCRWEASARNARLGLWSLAAAGRGTSTRAEPFIAAAPKPTQPSAGRCLINGNISDSGRIYHVPGSALCERTVIDESADERWFCAEDEAKSESWRALR